MKFLNITFLVFSSLVVSGCGNSDTEPEAKQASSGHV